MNGFCEWKFRSTLLSGIFTKAVMYIMLLCDSVLAGLFIGKTGVAAINAITPITGYNRNMIRFNRGELVG